MKKRWLLFITCCTLAMVLACSFFGQSSQNPASPSGQNGNNGGDRGNQWFNSLSKLNLSPINTANASAIISIGRLGRGTPLSISQSPKGNQISVGTTAGISIIDLSSFREVTYIDENTQASSVSYNRDGSQLAIGLGDGRILVYDPRNASVIKEIPYLAELPYYDPSQNRNDEIVAFSPDGQHFAVVGEFICCSINVFDLKSGEKQYTFQMKPSNRSLAVSALAFDNDGRYLVVVSDSVLVLDAVTGDLLQTVTGVDGSINDAKFVPGTDTLAIASGTGGIYFWSLSSQSVTKHITRDQLQIGTPLGHIDIGPDGNQLVFSDQGDTNHDSNVGLYRIQSEKLAWLVPVNDRVLTLAFNKDPNMVMSGGRNGYILFQSPADGRELSKLKSGQANPAKDLVFSRDGSKLVAGYFDKADIWRLPGGELGSEIEYSKQGEGVLALHPNGTILATSSSNGYSVDIWDLNSSSLLRNIDTKIDVYIRSLAFLQDGKLLAVATNSNVILLDFSSGNTISTYPVQHDGDPVAVNLDSSLLAFPSRKDSAPTIIVYDPRSGQVRKELMVDESIGSVQLAISAKGELLAMTMSDTMVVWDLASGKEVFRAEGDSNSSDPLDSLAFSPTDPRLLASLSSGGRLRLWNVQDMTKISDIYAGKLNSSGYGGKRIAFSLDGQLIVTASDDGSIQLWGVPK